MISLKMMRKFKISLNILGNPHATIALIANKIVRHLDTFFRDVRESELQEQGQTRKTKVESCVGLERVVSRRLPNLVPILKSRLKNDFGERNTTDCKAISSSVSLASAIIAAHQLLWCLKQVFHDG